MNTTITSGQVNKSAIRIPKSKISSIEWDLFEVGLETTEGDLAGTTSKYPPAKPGALRLLAPQRGLIAIGQNQKPRTIHC